MKNKKTDNPNLIRLLGTVPDVELANMFRLNSCTISRLRDKYRIPKYDRYKHLWEEIDPIIFKVSIRKIADRYGINRGVIDRRRKKIIKEYSPKE